MRILRKSFAMCIIYILFVNSKRTKKIIIVFCNNIDQSIGQSTPIEFQIFKKPSNVLGQDLSTMMKTTMNWMVCHTEDKVVL